MSRLGNGLSDANQHEDALSVQEAELSLQRRLGASEVQILDAQTNLGHDREPRRPRAVRVVVQPRFIDPPHARP